MRPPSGNAWIGGPGSERRQVEERTTRPSLQIQDPMKAPKGIEGSRKVKETKTSMAHSPGSAPWGRFLLTSALAFSLVLAGGCAAFFSPPSVEIIGVELVSLGLTSGTAAVTLELANQSSRKIDILGFLYALEVRDPGDEGGWRRLAGGFHEERIVLPKEQVQRVTVPVPFEYRALGAALQSFLTLGEVPYRLEGEVSVKGFGMELEVPFRSEGVVKP
jgi:LEA14-like dessication related protein